MKLFIKLQILLLLLISMCLQAQIRNGGFEEWMSGEPSYWQTNNIDKPDLKLTTITRTSDAYEGSSALKGEVVLIPNAAGQLFTAAPLVQSGSQSNPGFSFTGKPKQIRGYYKFQSVGGDRLIANAFLKNGDNLIAVSGITITSSTGSEYKELILDLFYSDTLTTPSSILLIFQIGPPEGQLFASAGSSFYLDDFPSILLIKPSDERNASSVSLQKASEFTEQIVFISGETDTIKWKGFGALNVDLDYSLDNGNSYSTIVNNYPADSNRYFWKVPKDLLTRDAKIRIVESGNNSNDGKSIKFTLKPWQLTRIDANNKLELFEVADDGWNFKNNSDILWPETWWQQFDYSGIDPNTNVKYPWHNSAFRPGILSYTESSVFPDWPLYVDVFGADKCYYSNNGGEKIYRSEATTHWSVIRANHFGSCSGFSISSLLYFYHKSNLLQKFPLLPSQNDLNNIFLNDNSRYIVNYYQIFQFGRKASAVRRAHWSDSPRQLLQQLKNMFKKENGDGRSLTIGNNNASGSHAVVPKQLKRNSSSSLFDLLVYDSNNPNNENTKILIDSLTNTWTDFTGLDYGSGSDGCFLRLESSEFLQKPTIPNSQNQKVLSKSSENSLERLIYNTSNADITISSSSGNQIGFKDSVSFGNLLEGIPIIPMTTIYQAPIGYDLPADSYSIKLNNFTDSSAYIYFLSGPTIYKYSRHAPNNKDTDELKISENGLEIFNHDQNEKRVLIESIVLEDSSGEKVFIVNNALMAPGSSIQIQEMDRKNLLFRNSGGNSEYDLYARSASADGESISFYPSIPLSQNSSHQIVPNWENLENEQIKILIDLDNDGTINDSLYILNQITKVDNESNSGMPENYELLQNYPNPFNPITKIRFSLKEQTQVSLRIYDILGREVAVLVNSIKSAGKYEHEFDAANLTSGIYFYTLKVGEFIQTKRMVLLK